MSGSARNWLVGCGLGCGALLLVIAALAVGGFFAIRNVVEDFERTESSQQALAERFGPIDRFVPEPDGSIHAARIETFLAVRERTREAREEMETKLTLLAEAQDRTGRMGARRAARTVTAGLGLLPEVAAFLTRRNEALLEEGMGPGEYLYLYSVAYYSWLGHSPADGPPFRIVGRDGENGRRPTDEFEFRESRLDQALRRLNRHLGPMLRRQADGIPLGSTEAGDATWRRSLEDEIAAMNAEPDRLPWADGVPDPLRRSLDPYHERLDGSYSPMCNPLEMMLGDS
jgi:hypothetical protein